MPIADSLITWIHLISASIWVGGSIFIGIVLVPMLKSLANTDNERMMLMIKIGRRFNRIALPALIVLLATGVYKAHFFLSSPNTLLDSDYGIILVVKISVVSSMLVLVGIHVRISNGKMEQRLTNANSDSRLVKLRTRIIWLGRIIVGQSIAILLFAAMLDVGI
ncbi:MAG: CopD family protein [Nitrososphaerales archaeon]